MSRLSLTKIGQARPRTWPKLGPKPSSGMRDAGIFQCAPHMALPFWLSQQLDFVNRLMATLQLACNCLRFPP